jgi:ABC-type multidrug transport system fused ATPase/permease subunit
VLPYIALEFALLLVSSVTDRVRKLFDHILQTQLTNHVNSLVIRKAISLDLAFFEDPIFYDTLENARRRADVSALNIVNSMLQMVQQVITLASLLVLLVRFSPWLALIVFVSAIPAFLSQSQYAERAFRVTSRRAPEARLLHYLETLLTDKDSAKEIKLFGLGEPLLGRYGELFTRFYLEDRQLRVGRPPRDRRSHHARRHEHVPGDLQAVPDVDPISARQLESPLREQPFPGQSDELSEAAATARLAATRPDRTLADPPGHRVQERLISLPPF